MSVTVTNLLQGPAAVWIGTFGATEPVNADAAPGTGWTNVGGTDGGAKLTVSQSYSNLTVDQIAMPVGSRMTDLSVSVDTSLAEATLANLKTALNMAAGAGTSLELDPTITNADPNYAAVLLIGQRPGGGNRLVIIRRALATGNVELAYAKDKQTVIPVTFSGFYVSAAVKPIKIDDTPGP